MVEAVNQEIPVLANIPDYVRSMKPYRPGKPIEEFKEEYGFDSVIKLASNENPFGPSPRAIEAAKAIMDDIFRYPDPISRKLRKRLAQIHNTTPEEIAIAAGSENLIALAIRMMLQNGDEAVSGQGAFLGLHIHLAAHGGKLVEVPSPNYRFDVDGLIAATTKNTKLLYLPNPNNPTGTYLTRAEVERILDNVPASTLVVLDEAYTEFCRGVADYPDAFTMRRDNVLIMRTFSKAYGLAGFRTGYAVGHAKLIEQMMKVKMTFEPSMPAQAAALAALDDTAFLNKVIDNNTHEMQRYYQFFDELGLNYIRSIGNFVMVNFDSEARVNQINEDLLKRGIAIRPLAAFGYPASLRITIGLPEENDKLFTALREVL